MPMTEEERNTFLAGTRIAILSTLNDDGSPTALPLWFEWDGEKIRMFSSRATGKVRRLRQNPHACVTVADPVGAPEAWVSVEGTVTVLDTGGKELALKLAAAYYEGEHQQLTIEAWGQSDDWVLLEMTPTRIRSM